MKRDAPSLMYVVAVVAGLIILLIALWVGSWDFNYWLSNPPLTLVLSFSQIVTRILSGFGLLVTYLVIFEGILIRFSTAFKGKKTKAKRVFALLIFIPVLLPAYSSFRLFYSWFYGNTTTFFDVIYLLVGMWGLIISVYLIPISTGEFSVAARISDFKTSEGKTDRLRRKVKKLYYEKIRKRYAEAYRIEVLRIRERLSAHRGYIGAALLLPFALGSLFLPPIALLFITLYVKTFIQRGGGPYSLLDRSILATVTIAAGVFSSVQIYASLGSLQLMLDVSYLIGTVTGYIAFLYITKKTL